MYEFRFRVGNSIDIPKKVQSFIKRKYSTLPLLPLREGERTVGRGRTSYYLLPYKSRSSPKSESNLQRNQHGSARQGS